MASAADVEADDQGGRSRCQVDVVLGDTSHAGVDDVDAHLRVLDLRQLPEERLDGALNVALEDEVELLDGALLHLREEVLERDLPAGTLRELLAAQALGAQVGECLAWRSCSTTRHSSPAGGGLSKPRISTGSPGLASLTLSR